MDNLKWKRAIASYTWWAKQYLIYMDINERYYLAIPDTAYDSFEDAANAAQQHYTAGNSHCLTVTDEMVERGIDAAIRANRPSVEYRNRDQREADEDVERPRYRALVRAALTAALEKRDD